MSRALIIHDASVGDTARLAQAIAEGIGAWMEPVVLELRLAPMHVRDVDLVIVGGPSILPGPRDASLGGHGERSLEPALQSPTRTWQSWLEQVDANGAAFATFDTRLSGPRWLWGSAARIAASRLVGRGQRVVGSPLSSRVARHGGGDDTSAGAGELDRARDWAFDVGRTAVSARDSLTAG